MKRLGVAVAVGMAAGELLQGFAQSEDAYERAPIGYSKGVPQDPVARLDARFRGSKVAGARDDREVVRRLLAEIGAPESSQLLVFSKTSFQNDLISPAHPRALYFSDDVYIGWVPGGLVEVASMDPDLGCIFYRFDPRQTRTPDPESHTFFVRDADCLRCHGGQFIRDIPGNLARSVVTDATGMPQLQFGSTLVDYTTPLAERWGGWYVTGRHGTARHRGNVIASGAGGYSPTDLETGANLTNLTSRVSLSAYLAPTSDIVALMVFEHQIAFHNALTKASFRARQMLAYQRGLQTDLKENITEEPVYESCQRVFAHAVQDLLDVLLFKDEAEFPAGGIEGSSSFATDFGRTALKDGEGRSLRDFQLAKRLFKYRCSYLIYTPGFTKLQPVLRRMVLERLWKALTQPATEPRYDYLTSHERETILGILHQTLSNLPPCFEQMPGMREKALP